MTGGAGDLTGAWFGSFGYDVPGEPEVSFICNLEDDGGTLTGTISEPNSFGPSGGHLSAIVSGAREGSHVGFAETYDGASDAMHRVDYAGTLDSGGTRIAGRWSLAGWSGPFAMQRTEPDEAIEETLAAAEADAEAPDRVRAPAPEPVAR